MLRPRWRKVLRDIWDNKARTILVVLAIAVGVFAFGSVFITREVLLADMTSGYRATNPATITLSVSGFDDGLVRAVQGLREVDQAEARATISLITAADDRDYNIDLQATRSFREVTINTVELEAGAWPERREILLERTSADVLGVSPGDSLVVELSNGDLRELAVSGIVHDYDAVPAGLFPWLNGFTNLETLEWLGHPGTYGTLRIIPSGGETTLEEIDTTAQVIRERVESYGYTVSSVSTQEPGKHWAEDTTRTFTTILSGIGFFSLALSGFLVLNTISAVMAQQRRQIGMMKAVGATGRQVTAIYLMMVAIFGVLALLVALPVGMGLGYLSTLAVANFLNIDILDYHLPLWVAALEALAALAAPVLAAVAPIAAGTRITVREAVSDYGIGLKTGTSLLDRVLARVRGLPRPTLLSIRNTFRRKGRLALTLTTLSLAGAIFIAVINVRGSLVYELDQLLRVFNFDVQLALDGPYQVSRLEREALRVEGVTAAESWSAAQAQRLRPDGTRGPTFQLFGPPADSPFIDATILEGRWLQPGDQNAIVLGSQFAREEPDVQVGDTIRLDVGTTEREWEVVGIASVVGAPFAYAEFDYLSRTLNSSGQAGVVFIGTERHDGAYQQEIGNRLADRFKQAGIGVGQSLTQDAIIGANISQFNFLIAFLLVMAVFMAVVGGLGLAGTMSLNVLERTREIGVMRAIGAATGAIRGIVVIEGVLIGLLSWALSMALSIPASYGFVVAVGNAFFERPMTLTVSPVGPLAWLAVVLVISSAASLMPARRAARISVREALAYE